MSDIISLWEAVKAINEKLDFLIGKLVEAEKKAKPKKEEIKQDAML